MPAPLPHDPRRDPRARLRRSKPLLPLFAILATSAATARAGDVLDVPGEYATIQAALDASTEGDEVAVAAGTYAITEEILFPAHGVTLRSASGDPTSTVLDGSALDDEPDVAIVLVQSDAQSPRRIAGLTFRDGPGGVYVSGTVTSSPVRVEGNRFEGLGPRWAVRAQGTGIEIVDNVFSDNRAYLWGGAVFAQSDLVMTGNTFTGNESVPFQTSLLTQGGAAYLAGLLDGPALTATIDGNHFEANACTDYGGAINVGSWDGTISITNNTFDGNNADVCAGAVYLTFLEAFATVEGNLFVGNGSPEGGAMVLESISDYVVRSNTFVGNFGNEALKLKNTTGVTVDRNLFAFNSTRAILLMGSPDVLITCNDAFGNPAGDYPIGYPSPGDGNVSLDPKLCDPDAGDYRLAEDSPCLPGGNACEVLIGALGAGCAASPTETLSWGAVKDRYSAP